MKKWIFAALLLVGLAAVAGQVVDQGSPGKNGAWPVTCTNCSASTGDGGATTVTNTPSNPLYVIVLDGGGSSSGGGTVTQGAGQDGGAWNVSISPVTTAGDSLANPTTAAFISYLTGYEPNAATWERLRASPVDSDSIAGHAHGALDVMNHAYVYNPDGGWDRMRGTATGGLLVWQGSGQDGGAWTVTQSTNDRLRGRGASEADAGTNVNTWAATVIGASDTSSLVRVPRAFDMDNDTGTEWVLGVSLRAPIFGGSQGYSTAVVDDGSIGLDTYSLRKLNHASPTSTSVNCSASSATAAPASIRTDRVTLTLMNNSAFVIYIGASGVTTSNGLPLQPGASFSDDVESTPYYCRSGASDGGTANLRVLEN